MCYFKVSYFERSVLVCVYHICNQLNTLQLYWDLICRWQFSFDNAIIVTFQTTINLVPRVNEFTSLIAVKFFFWKHFSIIWSYNMLSMKKLNDFYTNVWQEKLPSLSFTVKIHPTFLNYFRTSSKKIIN